MGQHQTVGVDRQLSVSFKMELEQVIANFEAGIVCSLPTIPDREFLKVIPEGIVKMRRRQILRLRAVVAICPVGGVSARRADVRHLLI